MKTWLAGRERGRPRGGKECHPPASSRTIRHAGRGFLTSRSSLSHVHWRWHLGASCPGPGGGSSRRAGPSVKISRRRSDRTASLVRGLKPFSYVLGIPWSCRRTLPSFHVLFLSLPQPVPRGVGPVNPGGILEGESHSCKSFCSVTLTR